MPMVGPEIQQNRLESYGVGRTGFWIFVDTKKVGCIHTVPGSIAPLYQLPIDRHPHKAKFCKQRPCDVMRRFVKILAFVYAATKY